MRPAERSLGKPGDITRPILERYQRHLYLLRKLDGKPLTDEHGVRVAGGETSDFGNGSGPRYYEETPEVGFDEASAAGWPIAAALDFFEQRFEAPFHWGSRCEDDPTATVSDMPTISLEVEPLGVRRYLGKAYPDQASEPMCEDQFVYRTVVELQLDDGSVAGRFYVSFSFVDQGSESFALARYLAPDLRNFSGSLTVPFDLERPHWSAMMLSFLLRNDGMSGSLWPTVNYTDDDEASEGGPPSSPGYAFGFWPADAQPSDATNTCGGNLRRHHPVRTRSHSTPIAAASCPPRAWSR